MRTITVYGPSRALDKCPVTIGECTKEYNGSYSTSCPCDYLLGHAPRRYPLPVIVETGHIPLYLDFYNPFWY